MITRFNRLAGFGHRRIAIDAPDSESGMCHAGAEANADAVVLVNENMAGGLYH